MNKAERQSYALTHPINRTDVDDPMAILGPLTCTEPLPGGDLLNSVLAVDR